MASRQRIAAGFEAWGAFVVRRRLATIALLLLFSAATIAQLPRLSIDTSIEGWLHPEDPTLRLYEQFQARFQRDDRIAIAVRTRDVFSEGFLARLRRLHRELEAGVPGLDELTSLVNARDTRGEGDALVVEELLGSRPLGAENVDRAEARALANPLYRDLLLSRDGRVTTLILRLEPAADPGDRGLRDRESHAAVRAVRGILARHAASDFEPLLAGAPVLNERITAGMQGDLRRFLGLAVLAVVGLLTILFRSVAAALLASAVVLLSLLATLGLAPLLGIPLQVPTQILPALLMAVGVGDSVHILAIFGQELRAGRGRERAIAAALGHAGLPVLMTSLTTAGALASFSHSELLPVANLGVLAPLGIGLALLYSLTLLPALLAVVPLRGAAASGGRPLLAFLERGLLACGEFAVRHPWKVVGLSAALLAVCTAVAAAGLRFSSDPLRWLRPEDPLRAATGAIDRELRGSVTIEALLDSGEENGLHEPELLRRLEGLADWNSKLAEGEIFVGKTVSLVDVVKEIHQALHENRPEQRAIPADRRLVAQELLLFEAAGSDDLREVADPRFRVARMSLKVPWADAIAYPPVLERIEAHYRGALDGRARVTLTGLVPLMSRTFEAVVASLARSYAIAFAIVAPLMCLLLGSLRAGLASMLPNLAPIALTLAAMAWLDLPLNAFTLLIGSIALGLAVDDTIHLLHAFERYHAETGDALEAVRRSLRTTGQALLFTTLVLCSGFAVFTLGSLRATFHFGFLTSFALAAAFVADVLLVPALCALRTRRRDPRPA